MRITCPHCGHRSPWDTVKPGRYPVWCLVCAKGRYVSKKLHGLWVRYWQWTFRYEFVVVVK